MSSESFIRNQLNTLMENSIRKIIDKYRRTLNKYITKEMSSGKKVQVLSIDPVTLDSKAIAEFSNLEDAIDWCYENKWRYKDKILSVIREGEIPGEVICIGYLRALKDRGEISEDEYWSCVKDLINRFEDEAEINYRKTSTRVS